MLTLSLRVVIGLVGALSMFQMARLWFDPAAAGAALGLVAQGATGLATLRADVAGFFGALGLFAMAGAVRNDGRLVLPSLVLVVVALAGRLLAAAHDGLGQAQTPPVVVEIVLTALFAAGVRFVGARRR